MIVLDTNVISELMQAAPSVKVTQWVGRQLPSDLCTTAINEQEVFYGIELLAHGKRRDNLLREAEGMFAQDLRGRILPFDSHAARVCARLLAHRRSLGISIAYADAQIAAIAQVHGAVLATRDVSDFVHCDIRVLDPWTA